MANETGDNYGYGKRPLWQWIAIYAVIAVVIYGLVYYFVLSKKGGYNLSGYNTSTPSYVSPTQAANNQSSQENIKQVIIEGNEFAFTPAAVTVQKGQAIEVTFKNTGAFPHDLAIADLNVQTKTIQPGEEDTIQFTPDKTGQFTFVCTVPGHADKGMKGTLIVQ